MLSVGAGFKLDSVLFQFDGEEGLRFRQACAIFCGNQSHALEVLRVKQKKDQKLAMFLHVSTSLPPTFHLSLSFIPSL